MDTGSNTTYRRNYWQLPTFILGIAAMAAAYKQFPPPNPSNTRQGQSAIKAVAAAMSAKPPAWNSVRNDVTTLESAMDATPVTDSTTAYLVGSWHLTAAENDVPAKIEAHWQQASRRFDQVEVSKLESPDVARFLYRKAKVDAMQKVGKPTDVMMNLLKAPPEEDTTERGRYVYDVAMRCTPPDLIRAREGLEEYLSGPAITKAAPEALASLKLELGRLFLNDGKWTEAKPWLEPAAGPSATPIVRASALYHLSQLAVAQRNPAEAETRLREALVVQGLAPAQMSQMRMLCGEGLMRLDRFSDAALAFAQASQEKGPIGIAAACQLAACNARCPSLNGGRKSEVEALEKCLTSLKADNTWDNPYIGIEKLRQTFEEVIRVCVNDGDVESATKAAQLYDRVAAKGRGTELKADTLMNMAFASSKKSETSQKSGELAKAAAKEFDLLATFAATPAQKVDSLRKSAEALKLAGDKNAARERLEQLLTTPGLAPDVASSVRMDLADVTADSAKIAVILQNVVEAGGAQAYTARVKLAVAQIDRAKLMMKEKGAEAKTVADGYTSAAVTLLEQAASATTVAASDQASHELALLTLGRIKMEQGQFPDAANRLRTLLQQYPGTKENERAKLYLASCLLVEGTAGEGNAARVKEVIELLEPLTKSNDPFLRSQAGVRTARARLAGKQWQEAVTAATTTADDAKGTIEELIALSLAYNGYAEQKRSEQCQVIETRMRRVLGDLPETQFTGAGPEYTRAYWKTNWIDWFDNKPKQ